MNYKSKQIMKYFDIKNPMSYESVPCPYHSDNHNSAGINVSKNHFNCFLCGGKNLSEVYNDVIGENKNGMKHKKNEFQLNLDAVNVNDLFKAQPKPVISHEQKIQYLKELIQEKKLTQDILQRLQAQPIIDETHHLFGYLVFPIGADKYVARKFIPELTTPKWINSNGNLPDVLIMDKDSPDIILVEGLFDMTALMSLGYNNVACNLGAGTNQGKRFYPLKNKVVYIFYDNDYPGFTGTKKAYDSLRQIKAHPIPLEMPDRFGKDANEALNHPEFAGWLRKQLTEIDSNDVAYLENIETDLRVYNTPFQTLNTYYVGGYRPGIHLLAGLPGSGKSAYLLELFVYWTLTYPDTKWLYCTYEIPKSQCWARITAMFDNNHSWTEIETNPSLASQEAKDKTKIIAQRLKIQAGTTVQEVVRALRNYDGVCIDYIQRMPGDTDSEKTNISRNAKELGNQARDKEKIVLVASSMPRTSYGKEDLTIFKECGDLEYISQSALLIKDINHAGEGRLLELVVLKNTRGQAFGNLWMEANMLHNKFKEVNPTG